MASPGELDVAQVAHLARIALTAEEKAVFQKQLHEILQHAESLGRIVTTGVEATAHENPLFDVWRSDTPRDFLTVEEALRDAPQQANDLFLVTRVLG